MKASIISILFLLIASCAAAQVKLAPITDWNKAYQHAKNGRTVELVINDAKLDFGRPPIIRIFIADGGKEYYVASVAPFPKDSTANYLIDLSQVLGKLQKAPSPNTKIVVDGGVYKSLQINLK